MSAPSIHDSYAEVLQQAAELNDLESAASLLGWDQETKMPKRGVDGRAHVSATLAGVIHEKWTHPRLAETLQQLAGHTGNLGEIERAQIEEFHRLYLREAKLPADLVKAVAETQSKAVAVWADAREANDFSRFVPILDETIKLKREVTDAVGYPDDPYDALLDEYEPGAKTAEIAALLGDVRDFLVPLVRAIAETGTPLPTLLDGPFDIAEQDRFGRKVVTAMGFDMEAGRLDLSQHPFTSGIHSGDTRLTTRYHDNLTMGLFGTMHEAGHGLYEQNLPQSLRRSPLGGSTSLGIHESQSRLWENMVGRSRAFWQHFFPVLQQHFPAQVGNVDLDTFYAAINDVRPSLIRIEADEVTYNLHIVIRFEIEREMIAGRVKAADLHELWNAKYAEYLGVTPPSADVGVLQDIHWSMGSIGYFPTYTLGNLYAAQFFAAAERELPLKELFAAGNLLPLKDWLVRNIHGWGRRYGANELAHRTIGEGLNAEYFKTYIREKYKPLYGLG